MSFRGKLSLFLASTAMFGMPAAVLAQAAAEDQSGEQSELQEIIVTAQKRSERLQDVPVAVTALTGDAIEQSQFTNFNDIQFLAPSVQLTGGSSPNFQIRGVGTNAFDFSIEGSVGVVLDQVPQVLPRTTFLNTLTDLDRIEVLRGPQGTLFGKNTSAGVISVTTKPVDLTQITNDAKASWGSFNDINVSNVFNAPFNDKLGIRVALSYRHRDGFVRNAFTGKDLYERDDFAGTVKLRFQPSETLDFTLIGDFQSHRDNGHAIWTLRNLGTGIANTTFVPGNFVTTNAATYGIVAGPANQRGAWDGPIYNKIDTNGVTLIGDWDLGPVVLTSVTGYRTMDYSIALDTDSTPLPFYSINKGDIQANQISQELRIASSGGPIDYVIGAFANRYRTQAQILQAGTYGLIPATSPFRLGNNVPGSQDTDAVAKNFALFANVAAPIVGELKIIGGARLTRDDIKNSFIVNPLPGICLRAAPGPVNAIAGTCLNTPRPGLTELTAKRTDWSGKIGLQYDIDPDVMVYASVARGYKGPGITIIGASSNAVDPETSIAYEAGLKADLFDRRMAFNLALYRTDYKDFQAQTLIVFNGTNQYAVANAGALRVQGIELETTALIAPGLTINANVAYNDAKFRDFITQCFPGQTAAQGCQPAVPASGGNPAIPARFQAARFALNNAPKWTLTGGINYEGDVSSNLKLDASINATYKSQVYFSIGDVNTIQPAYAIVNATLGLATIDDKWRVGLFARNLFDQNYVVQIAPTIGDNRGGTGFVVGYHNRPTENANRTLGVSVDFKFR